MRLAETEYRIMNLVWTDEGITAKDLAEALNKSVGWSKTTTYTVISRCIQKGYIRREDPKFHCYPMVSRIQVAEMETDSLIGHYFDGSAESLIQWMLSSGRITPAQLESVAASAK